MIHNYVSLHDRAPVDRSHVDKPGLMSYTRTLLAPLIESLKDPTLQAQLDSRLVPLRSLLSRLVPSSSSSSSALVNFSVSVTLQSALDSLRVERDELLDKYESVVLELESVKHKCDRWKLEYERVQRGETSGEGDRTGQGEVKQEDKSGVPGRSVAPGETSGEGQRLLKEEGDKAAMEDRIAGVSLRGAPRSSVVHADASDDDGDDDDRPTAIITPKPMARS